MASILNSNNVVGDIIRVPIDTVITIDNFENKLSTGGEDATIIQKVIAGNTGVEDFFNYQLQFSQTFDVLTSSGTTAFQTTLFWFTQDELTGAVEEITILPFEDKDINNSIRSGQKDTTTALKQGSSVLNKIPATDPIFKDLASNLVDLLNRNSSTTNTFKFNARDETLVSNAHSNITASELLAADSSLIATFLNNLLIQQQTISKQTTLLKKQETQSLNNVSQSLSNLSRAVNAAIENRAIVETDNLQPHEGYKTFDWDKIEPVASSDLPPEETTQEKAARLFPLLDAAVVVKSGLV